MFVSVSLKGTGEDCSLLGEVVEISRLLRSGGGGGGRKRSLNTAIPSFTETFVGGIKVDRNSSSWVSIERLLIDERDLVPALDNGVSNFKSFEEGDGEVVWSSTMLEVCRSPSSLSSIFLLECTPSSGSVVSVMMEMVFAMGGGGSLFAGGVTLLSGIS